MYELLPSSEFAWDQKLHEWGVIWVSNSKGILDDIKARIKTYDPDGNCCKGACIAHIAISGHTDTGTVTLSTDFAEGFSLNQELAIEGRIEKGVPLSDLEKAAANKNAAALDVLRQIKSKLCRNAKVSIVQCASEYPVGNPKSLKARLQDIFGPNVEIETSRGNCKYRVRMLPFPARPDYDE